MRSPFGVFSPVLFTYRPVSFARGIGFQVGRLEFHVHRVVSSVHVHLEYAGGPSERERRFGCLGVDTVGEAQRVCRHASAGRVSVYSWVSGLNSHIEVFGPVVYGGFAFSVGAGHG